MKKAKGSKKIGNSYRVDSRVLAAGVLFCSLLILVGIHDVLAGTVSGANVSYTTDADFDEGTLVNVNHDVVHDQLQLNEIVTPFPFINVAASNRGTILRIDVNTGAIIGEYYTSPNGMQRNPSRTTVDLTGSVWVSNRNENGYSPAGSQTRKGSLTRVGLIIGGTRVNADGTPNPTGQYLKAPFQYNTCVDRNGDGLIKTSRGRGNILAWTNANGADTHGGVSTADDECIINYTRTIATNTRTVAIDADNNVWVGGANMAHEKIDGATGQPVPGTQFNLGCGGYGGLIDKNGVLWSARYGNGLLRFDTKTMTGRCLGNSMGNYGLGIDPNTGEIWHSAHNYGFVGKIAPDGTLIGKYDQGFSRSQGVAVDDAGNVWVAHAHTYSSTVGHLRTNGTYVGSVTVGTGPTGVAVDANGKVWATNYNSHTVSRIDPNAGPVGGGGYKVGAVDMTVSLGSGAYPYNYSDMTGYVSIGSTSQQGIWTVIQDSGVAGNRWGTIAWNTEPEGSQPAGTQIIIEARAAETEAGLPGQAFISVSNNAPFMLLGRFIEARVILKPDDAGTSPVLSDITISGGFTDVHVIETISSEGIVLDEDSFVTTPSSITPQADRTVIEWRFDNFSPTQTEDLSFDVIMQDPIPGENRLVNHKLEILYLDLNGNPVRTELGPHYVHVLDAAFETGIATDKPIYQANEDVLISARIKNLSEYARTVDARVLIEDTGGVLVTELTTLANLSFEAGEEKTFDNLVFNTGTTLSGDYRAHLLLFDGGKQVGEAFADFIIGADIGIASTVTTDKMTYGVYEPVAITSTVESTSANYILTDLTTQVTLKNPTGVTLFTDAREIPTLTPGGRLEFKSFWNTAANPAGIYTVFLEILKGTTSLSIAQTSFSIRDSSVSVEGLIGTISATPSPVYRGASESIAYSVTNSGNMDIANLQIQVLIVNPDTEEIKHTYNTSASIQVGSESAGGFSISTIPLEPRPYVAILRVQSASMSEAKTIAHVTFEVIPGLEATKTILDMVHLLVWVNDKCDHDSSQQKVKCPVPRPHDCIRVDLLEQILNEAGVTYHIVYKRCDFEHEMRNPFYTDFMILGDRAPLRDHYADELREQVYSGKGLLSSLYLKHGKCFDHWHEDDPLFGLIYRGRLPGSSHRIEIPEGVLSGEVSFEAKGDALRVETDDPEQILGWITRQRGGHCCPPMHKDYPGIIKNQYGEGKTLFFAFDIGVTLDEETYQTLSEIFKNSLSLIHTPADTELFAPFQYVPIAITLQNLDGALDLRITETYPEELTIYDPYTEEWITDRPWAFDVHLDSEETAQILYYAFTPDQAGTHVLETEIAYVENENSYPCQMLSVTIPVVRDAAQTTQDILEALDALQVSRYSDKAAIKIAMMFIYKVKTRPPKSPFYAEKNIHDILKAIDALRSVKSADTSAIRLMMDELLQIWETTAYLSPHSPLPWPGWKDEGWGEDEEKWGEDEEDE